MLNDKYKRDFELSLYMRQLSIFFSLINQTVNYIFITVHL